MASASMSFTDAISIGAPRTDAALSIRRLRDSATGMSTSRRLFSGAPVSLR
jgi:hypothetical protein